MPWHPRCQSHNSWESKGNKVQGCARGRAGAYLPPGCRASTCSASPGTVCCCTRHTGRRGSPRCPGDICDCCRASGCGSGPRRTSLRAMVCNVHPPVRNLTSQKLPTSPGPQGRSRSGGVAFPGRLGLLVEGFAFLTLLLPTASLLVTRPGCQGPGRASPDDHPCLPRSCASTPGSGGLRGQWNRAQTGGQTGGAEE